MALDFFAKRKFRKEIKKLQAEIDKSSESRPDLLLKIAAALSKLDKHDEAVATYLKVVNIYIEDQRLGQAEAVCKSVLEIYPDSPEIQKIYNNLSKPEKIQEPLEQETEYDKEVENLMDEWNVREESDELTPVAEYNELKPSSEYETWTDNSAPDDVRIPSPPLGAPSVTMTLNTISEQFVRESSEITISDNVFPEEVIDIFEDEEEDVFQSWQEDFFDTIPFFSSLSPELREEFKDSLIPQKYEIDEIVVREGDSGTSLFMLLHGELGVTRMQPDGTDLEVTKLAKGDFFGELAMLADQKRHATVIATKPSSVLEIPKSVVVRISKKAPEVTKAIKEFYKKRLQEIVLTNIDFFKLIPEENRNKYLGDLRFRQFAPHTSIIKQGTKTGGFFLLLLGEVEVVVRKDDKNHKLAVLKEGDFFGEIALLKRKPAMASVVSLDTVEIVQIPPKTFFQILADHPAIWKKLNQIADKRQLVDHYLLSGMSSKKLFI